MHNASMKHREASAGTEILKMKTKRLKIDVKKLRHQLQSVRIASLTAIELGDCRAVARLTCEAGRLQNCISLVEVFGKAA
jgi:hypothetical protein